MQVNIKLDRDGYVFESASICGTGSSRQRPVKMKNVMLFFSSLFFGEKKSISETSPYVVSIVRQINNA